MAENKDRVGTFVARVKKNVFDLDADSNMVKASDLLRLRVSTEKKLFELDQRFRHEKNKMIVDEEFQKQGKNAETRNALMELELAGTDYDTIAEMKYFLSVISSTERCNGIIMDLFFRSK